MFGCRRSGVKAFWNARLRLRRTVTLTQLIDLTGTISNRMWRYPPPFRNPEIRYIETEADWGPSVKFHIEEIHMNTLVGTYFETPAHFFDESFTVDQWPVEELIREALLIKVPKNDNKAITLDEVREYLAKEEQEIVEGDSVLVATGWDRKWNNRKIFVSNSPYFDEPLVDWLLRKGISLLGSDIPSFDNIRSPQQFMPRLMQKGVVILAPLINLMLVPTTRVKVYLFPLKIEKACASPCRVICEY